MPTAAEAPFDTIVVLMMENRSFDHFLGWAAAADGKQSGLSFADRSGTMRARDKNARNLAEVLSFSARARPVELPALAAVQPAVCSTTDNAAHATW